MLDLLLDNIIPLLTGLGGIVGGFMTHKYATINSKTDSIKQLLEQNAELVSEVNRLQDQVISLSRQLAECQIEISQLKIELAKR